MKLRIILPVLFGIYLFFSFFSITVSQIILAASFFFWIFLLIKNKQKPEFPPFFWALVIYSLFSLLSSFNSFMMAESLRDSRELLLFLLIPMIYTTFNEEKEIRLANYALLASGLISSLYCIFHFFFEPAPWERATGFMSHYMTEAGLLLLFSCLALSSFFKEKSKIKWIWGTGYFFSLVALVLTLTRNSWIGVLVATCVILLLYKPKLLVLVPVAAGLLFVASPRTVKDRALSIFSMDQGSNRYRIQYIKVGTQIMCEYPLLGTGPNTVHRVFQNDKKYKMSREARDNVHLHNNVLQIGAERGMPALLAWLVFLAWVFIPLIRILRNKDPSTYGLAATAIATVLAFFAAGFFEYNWGDSEVVMLFCYLITLPFALGKTKNAQKSQD